MAKRSRTKTIYIEGNALIWRIDEYLREFELSSIPDGTNLNDPANLNKKCHGFTLTVKDMLDIREALQYRENVNPD